MEKFKLEEAIKIDGVLVSEITLRKPKVKDLLTVSKKDMADAEREVYLISNLAEIPTSSVEELSLSDYLKIQEWLQTFLSRTTAKK